MDFTEIYHFLFETYAGIGVLVGGGIVISIIVSILLEIRTRKMYRNHEPEEEDEWSIFEEEVVEAEAEELAAEKAKRTAAQTKASATGAAGADAK